MTCLDKIMEAIRFNDELLSAEEIELLRKCCKVGISVCVSPSRFSFLRGSEASPEPPFDKEWDKEISQ